MADTTSIASRMEKLAQLKRMKRGQTSAAPDAAAPAQSSESPVETPVQEAAHAPASEATLSVDEMAVAFDETNPDFDFAGGASDDSGAADFTSEAATETAEADLEIPADLRDEDESETAESAGAAQMTAADLGIDDEAMDALDDLVALSGVGEMATDAPATPDFTMAEIDPELLDREFEHEATETAEDAATDDAPMSSEESDGRVSVTFDESRSTLLNHVSRQMNCSVEDVVVTALDWYLDALFGEDEEAKAG